MNEGSCFVCAVVLKPFNRRTMLYPSEDTENIVFSDDITFVTLFKISLKTSYLLI